MIIYPKGIICVTCKEVLAWDSRTLMWGVPRQAGWCDYVQTWSGGHDHWPMPVVDDDQEMSD